MKRCDYNISMGMYVSSEVTIRRPVGEVYSYICNLQNMPFYTKVVSVEKVSGNGEVGTKYTLTTQNAFSKTKKEIEITQRIGHGHFAYKDLSVNYVNENGYKFEEQPDGGVKVIAYKSANIGALYSILTLNFGNERQVKAELTSQLLTLKKIFEA